MLNSWSSNPYPGQYRCGDPGQLPIGEIEHGSNIQYDMEITSFEARITIRCNSPDFLKSELSYGPLVAQNSFFALFPSA